MPDDFSVTGLPAFKRWYEEQYGVPWGTPVVKRRVPPTATERAASLRMSVTPEGNIPYLGNESERVGLEKAGWTLVSSDQFGPLPEDEWYFAPPTTPPPDTGVGLALQTPEVISQGGQDIMVIRDSEGNIIEAQALGPTRTEEEPQRVVPQPAEDPRLRALEFENLKLQLMSDPSKWIQLFYLEQMQQARAAAMASARFGRRQSEQYTEQAAAREQVSERTPPTTYRPTPSPVWGRLETGLSRTVAGSPVHIGGATPETGAPGILERQQREERRELSSKRPKPFHPQEPEIPTALQPFITGGFGSTRITPPSLQAWRRLSPSQQEMFRGYLEFVGRPYMDILGRLEQQETTGTRIKPKWTPARSG